MEPIHITPVSEKEYSRTPERGGGYLVIVERIGDILQEVQASEGLAVLLAEQNATWALSLAKRAVILDLGRISMTGDAAALLDDPNVRKAYLGV
jgi:branched-chain amino acid transport system ATP-binding protein